MSHAIHAESGLNYEAHWYLFELLLVDLLITDVVAFYVDIQSVHNPRENDALWILGLPEVCWILVIAEAASVCLLEHVIKLGSGHLRTT